MSSSSPTGRSRSKPPPSPVQPGRSRSPSPSAPASLTEATDTKQEATLGVTKNLTVPGGSACLSWSHCCLLSFLCHSAPCSLGLYPLFPALLSAPHPHTTHYTRARARNDTATSPSASSPFSPSLPPSLPSSCIQLHRAPAAVCNSAVQWQHAEGSCPRRKPTTPSSIQTPLKHRCHSPVIHCRSTASHRHRPVRVLRRSESLWAVDTLEPAVARVGAGSSKTSSRAPSNFATTK